MTNDDIRAVTSIIAVCISSMSFVLSALSLWRTRKSLRVRFSSTLYRPECLYQSMDDLKQDKNKKYESKVLYCEIEVINTAPTNIAHFDHEVLLLDKRGKIIDVAKPLLSLDATSDDEHSYVKLHNQMVAQALLPLPHFGSYESNSFNLYHIIMTGDNWGNVNKIFVSFKTAQYAPRFWRIIKNRYSQKRYDPYRRYSKLYKIQNIENI